MATYTLDLIKAVRSGEIDYPYDKLIDLAAKNKILLHFLRTLNISSELRDREESRYTNFLNYLEEVNNILRESSYVYAFFKLYKPIQYVPADIDVLVSVNHLPRIAKTLLRHGFRLEVYEPYTLTFTRGELIIDLYTYPSLGNMVYLDGQRLLRHRKTTEFNGIEISTLREYAEAVAVLTHAINKEWIYTLNDYFTVSLWFNRESIRLCRELGCIYEARIALLLNKLIEAGLVETPVKFSNGYKFIVWIRKIFQSGEARSTILRSIYWLRDPRLGRTLLSKLTRESY